MTNEAVSTKIASAATYGGSSAAVIFGLTANEFAAISGVVIAICGLLVNIYFKHQHLKIAKKNAKPDEQEK
jgi:uncharacterized membrane protein